MFKILSRLSVVALLLLCSCSALDEVARFVGLSGEAKIDEIAESYVKLVLEIGLYDSDYVDAYNGPEEWKPAELENDKEKEFPSEKLESEVNKLIERLKKVNQKKFSSLEKLRYAYLERQLLSVRGKILLLSGKEMTFDEESQVLYDAIAPVYNAEYFEDILQKLDDVLPGEGSIYDRFNAYREEFVIPKDRLEAVFNAAMAECRRRTQLYIELPEDEKVILEFVVGKSWGAYNWYKGNSVSLIQINSGLPVYIDRAVDLASHEGYPGHHVNLTLLEKRLVTDINWIEYCVYPLFSPRSLISEGIAEYGIDIIFPGNERVEFEQKVLFPLAGLDPAKAERYYHIINLKKELKYALNEAARRYIDGRMNADEVTEWLMKYSLMTPKEAKRAVRFIEQYRSYVINYSLGEDMVKECIKKHAGEENSPYKSWGLFYTLLSTPQTPSGLVRFSQ
ncbi:MAG: hypothetical protein PVH77_11395 [Phycisphaerales bacterium]|jgi:hypothetical protein